MPGTPRRWPSTVAYTISIALFSAPLLAHAYVGYFTRYMADDYCTAAALGGGLLPMQKFFYVNWSGRFSFTLTAGLVEMLGPRVVPLLPAALLALWLAALVWACAQFRVRTPGAVLLAGVVAFATLDDNKGGVTEALYWQTGSLTYFLPLVLLTLLGGYMARLYFREGSRVGAWRCLLCGALALYAGGFSETFVAAQTAALGLALAALAVLLPRPAAKKMAAPLLCAGAFSILALAIVAAAPGNRVRQSRLPPRPGLVRAAGLSAENAAAFAFTEHNYPVTIEVRLAALAAPLLLAFFTLRDDEGGVRPRPSAMIIISAAAFIVIVACLLPSYYAMSREPPSRALITAQFVLVCGLTVLGYLLGASLRRRYSKPSPPVMALCVVLAAVMAMTLFVASRKTLAWARKARPLAAIWDKQDGEIRSAVARGERRLTVYVLYNIGGTDVMTKDSTWYVNECAAAYYGAESITAIPGGDGGRIIFGDDSTEKLAAPPDEAPNP